MTDIVERPEFMEFVKLFDKWWKEGESDPNVTPMTIALNLAQWSADKTYLSAQDTIEAQAKEIERLITTICLASMELRLGRGTHRETMREACNVLLRELDRYPDHPVREMRIGDLRAALEGKG